MKSRKKKRKNITPAHVAANTIITMITVISGNAKTVAVFTPTDKCEDVANILESVERRSKWH